MLKKRNNNLGLYIGSCLTAIAILMCLYYLKGYAPFGDKSLACLDANVDYLDFLANLKDALEGKTSFVYSFSKGIGGNIFGVFASGYFSPIHLLVVFFEKSSLHTFFDYAIAIKISLAATSMAFFLRKRFSAIPNELIFMFSICYALCQYNFAQASNIFFLEGSYTLPLFLLGTYYIANKRSPYILIGIVAYTIVGNWYMAGINCIFTGFWAVFEMLWLKETNKTPISKGIVAVFKTAVAGITGVLLSGVLFIPAIVSLQKSSEGTLDIHLFKGSNRFLGNIITVITDYYWGATSSLSFVALFCGCISLVGCIAFYLSERYSRGQKLVVGGLLTTTVLMYYWYPLFLCFSLFKDVGSFWSRYGYIGSFVMVFIACLFFDGIQKEKAINIKKELTIAAMAIIAIMLLYYKDADGKDLKWIYATIAGICIVTFLVTQIIENDYSLQRRQILTVSLIVFSLFEMWCNAWLLMNAYHQNDVDDYKEYISQGLDQIETIKASDSGYYRISQTRTRCMTSGNLTANYDEAHALNYWGVASYTSVPDDLSREFLDRSGYRINGEDMYIVNYPILPVDSFLGVKYVLSDKDIPGMVKDDSFGLHNNKMVYVNPYALPMAFITDKPEYMGKLNYNIIETTNGKASATNPFLYQNDLYSLITGEKTELFEPVKYEKRQISDNEIEYVLESTEGNRVIYGNLPWEKESKERIYVNDELVTDYARWTSPSVFPINGDSEPLIVRVTAEEKVSIKEEQFYSLNTDLLEKASAEVQKNAVKDCIIENGKFKATINSTGSERLITSIPYEPQWEIMINGEKTDPDLFADTFIALPLHKGENIVEFIYCLGGFDLGIAFTIVGLLLLGCIIFIENRKKRN